MSLCSEMRAAADGIWERQHAHPFVRGIGDGTLPQAAFQVYVRQDYLFLIDYGRLLALGAARAPRLDWMRRFAELAHGILVTEMDLHRSFAREWGVSEAELEAEQPLPATSAYSDFLLRTAALHDFAELVAALLPCMWGYAEIGGRLAEDPPAHEGYRRWVEMYAGEEFQELAAWCRELTEATAGDLAGPARARVTRAFVISSEHELAFWESAWNANG